MNRILTRLLLAAAFILSPALASAKAGQTVSHPPTTCGGSTNFGNQ